MSPGPAVHSEEPEAGLKLCSGEEKESQGPTTSTAPGDHNDVIIMMAIPMVMVTIMIMIMMMMSMMTTTMTFIVALHTIMIIDQLEVSGIC